MNKKTALPASVDAYIARWDPRTRAALTKLRAVIRKAAPEAEERISYRMPAYFMNGVLVYFAGWEKHIGLYPGARAIEVFADDLAGYVHAKGSIQFPLDKPIPVRLVTRIVRFRIADVAQKNEQRLSRKRTRQRTGPGRKGTPR